MLSIREVSKNFEDKEDPVLHKVSLDIEEGEFFVLLGRSGCGKTTLLRCLGGFIRPDGGAVFLDGHPVLTPGKERMMVFQSFDQLFPWLTLKRNITYAMKKAVPDSSREEREEAARSCLKAAGLLEAAGQYPQALSGGMKQRGALARALALKPRILLMDEPFSSLDYLSRKGAGEMVKKLAGETGCTVFLVTHDIEEAILLGTRIGILDQESHSISGLYNPGDYEDPAELRRELLSILEG